MSHAAQQKGLMLHEGLHACKSYLEANGCLALDLVANEVTGCNVLKAKGVCYTAAVCALANPCTSASRLAQTARRTTR